MKIGQEVRAQIDAAQKNHSSIKKSSTSFQNIVQKESDRMRSEEIQKLLTDITKQGEILGRSRTFKDLSRYKRLVKQFIEEAVQHGMDLKQSHSWNMNGQNRRFTTVEEVDKKLIELTDAIMEQESRSIDLLSIIGEIKGLLVNLYM
ncbi:YaaR family protein [Bacillaceae bacterium S4-13-58]